MKKKLATQVNAKFVLICSQYGIPDSIELYEQGFDFTLPKPVTCLALRNVFVSVNNNRGSLTQNISAKLKDAIRVLLVEDNLINQEVATLLLEDLGFRVDLASGGVQALDMLSSSTERVYDVVLMDCLMPDMDGYEATAKIRQGLAGENQKDIPIIALTANAMSGDKERCIAAGMNDFVTKPFSPRILKEQVLKTLGLKAQVILPQKKTDQQQVQIDLKYLKEFSGGDLYFIRDMLETYITEAPLTMQKIQMAVEKENWEEVYKGIHKMKPSFIMLGMQHQHDLAAEVERMVRLTEFDTALVCDKLNRISADTQLTLPLLREKLAQINKATEE